MCNLALPYSIIDGILIHSNTYAMSRTKLDGTILVDGVTKRNPIWMHPNKWRNINPQDILSFFACYYYMGYCRLPARQDCWVQRQPHSCLPAYCMEGQFSCDKFEYVQRHISLNSPLTVEEIDNSVKVDNDGQFKPEEEVEELLVKTVEEDDDDNDDDDNNDDDDDYDKSKEDDEQNPYVDDKLPGLEL